VPIPGSRTAAHLAECAAAAKVDPTDDQLAEIERELPLASPLASGIPSRNGSESRSIDIRRTVALQTQM
jgi:hypothetical protein